ncbi:MAG: YggU family protein [Verrucomicrobia bacterium]|nr:MAG: YggU family protein [Verrucomicrobiota bacterium]
MATLRVEVVPNARIDKVIGEHGDAIKIKLRAPAVEGKANSALISFLAEQLNISQRAIVLEHGQRSRNKLIRITDLSEEEVRCRLLGAV